MLRLTGWDSLPSYSQALYKSTYFLPGEDYEAWLTRVTQAYKNDDAHAARMANYIKRQWFHPSTPPSSNAGTNRGLPISCFTGFVPDTKAGIFQSFDESNWLGAFGGGLGWDWSAVREVNHKVGQYGGKSSGVIPFFGVSDRSTLAVSQGGLRRASQAVYLRIDHPEILEFIDLRKPTGDQNRRAPNLHHGVVITDKFMNAVLHNQDWDLISPKDKTVIKTVKAQKLWTQLLEVRATLKGEPYLLFIDTVNKNAPLEYKNAGIKVSTSNLCAEITLRTDENHSGVCCLGSINVEYWDEFSPDIALFVADCLDYLDNVLQDFIDQTKDLPGFERARAGAIDERSLGLGVMGYHSLLQSKMIPFDSPMAIGLNQKVFSTIYEAGEAHNRAMGINSPSPLAARSGIQRRNTHITSTAPTMSISGLAGVCSSGIEPWIANAFTKKVQQGSFPIKNKYLERIITEQAFNFNSTVVAAKEWVDAQWLSIKKENGSVQHLEWLSQNDKDVFKTAFEIDQRHIITQAGQRQPFIGQSQSLKIFVPGGSNVQYISDLHILGWKSGVKSFYYLRSSAISRASTSGDGRKSIDTKSQQATLEEMNSDTCIGCG